MYDFKVLIKKTCPYCNGTKGSNEIDEFDGVVFHNCLFCEGNGEVKEWISIEQFAIENGKIKIQSRGGEKLIDKKQHGITEGRIVHYVMRDGKHRAAIIVNAWSESSYQNGEVNLTVFPDWTNDLGALPQGTDVTGSSLMWATSVPYSEMKGIGTWHWPEKE